MTKKLTIIGVLFALSSLVLVTPVSAEKTTKSVCKSVAQLMPWEKNEKDCVNPTPIPTKSVKPASLDSEKIFTMINDHRKNIGLVPFEKEEKLCKLAEERGPELYDEIFVTGDIHGGFYRRNIPYWITENMKYGPDEEDVFSWWMNSPIHRKAIEGDFKYSCGVCYGNSCAQLFTSYVKKQ